MSAGYQAVQWNRQKRIYDLVLAGCVGTFLFVFAGITKFLYPLITDEILVMRAVGTAAFLLLHIILCIGPLCRLNPKFLPLLYNRRHAGVTMCLLGLVHAAFVVLTYHAGGDANPLLTIFVSTPVSGPFAAVPFQVFGFFALLILLLMAATSHDFWLANLTAPVWKTLHMLVYVAYALLVLHVTFGILQSELSGIYVVGVALGLFAVLSLHLVAAFREKPFDRNAQREEANASASSTQDLRPLTSTATGWVRACSVKDIPDNRAKIICLTGERVAIFKYGDKISAVSNVCQHQNGPLGEGKIIDGCITCPWHGYQYLPDTGASPPPFVEKIPTFKVRIENDQVLIHPKPNPPGTRAIPASCSRRGAEADATAQPEHEISTAPPVFNSAARPNSPVLTSVVAER
jgi:sulfoxide reductase heme-binding subunit YedZ